MRGGLHERQAFPVEIGWPGLEPAASLSSRERATGVVRSFAMRLGLLALLVLGPSAAVAEEGMWTFDAFPSAAVEQTLGVHLDQAWLDHLRAGSVRLTSGCSGALVSPRGLVVTNQHCVLACAQAI